MGKIIPSSVCVILVYGEQLCVELGGEACALRTSSYDYVYILTGRTQCNICFEVCDQCHSRDAQHGRFLRLLECIPSI